MTSRTLLCFVTSGAIFAHPGRDRARAENLPLPVSVAVCSELSMQTVQHAEAEAAKIFRHIGVGVQWREVQTESESAEQLGSSTDLALRIVSQTGRVTLSKEGLALTHWGDGSPAGALVFLDRARSLAAATQVSIDVVLGCLIAHELGHLVLRSQKHSPFGLMRNPWTLDDMNSARAGLLGFTDDQAKPIRNAVSARILPAR